MLASAASSQIEVYLRVISPEVGINSCIVIELFFSTAKYDKAIDFLAKLHRRNSYTCDDRLFFRV